VLIGEYVGQGRRLALELFQRGFGMAICICSLDFSRQLAFQVLDGYVVGFGCIL